MIHRVLNNHKARSIIHVQWSDEDNPMRQCASMSPQSHCGAEEDAHWIFFMTLLYMHYAPCYVLVKHSVCHEPITTLINVFTLLS